MRRNTKRNPNRFGRRNYEDRVYSDRNLYETNARTYRGEDYDPEIYSSDDNRRRRATEWQGGGYGRTQGRQGWRYTRDDRNVFERVGDRIRNTWDRMTNNDERDYASERDRDRLEREYGHGSRGGFGYSRYSSEDYGGYRSGADDDMEYAEDLRNRGYDDTRYGEDYSDVWRGERNTPQIRRRSTRRHREREFSW